MLEIIQLLLRTNIHQNTTNAKHIWVIILVASIAGCTIGIQYMTSTLPTAGFIIFMLSAVIGILAGKKISTLRKNHATTFTIPAAENNNEQVNTKENLLDISNIPGKLLDSYSEIIGQGYAICVHGTDCTVRSLYLHTIKRGNKGRKRTTNNALFIEHQFADTTQKIDTYVSIAPDTRDNIASKIGSFLMGPIIVLGILSEIFDGGDMTELSNFFSSRGIHPYVPLIFTLLFSSYIGGLIVKKYRGRNAVKLESRGFEKKFDVDSNDPIVARQVCNPVFIADVDQWLHEYNIDSNTTIYVDFEKNRILYKLDYMIHDPLEDLSDTYVKKCIALTAQMINKIDIIKYMSLVYAGTVVPAK